MGDAISTTFTHDELRQVQQWAEKALIADRGWDSFARDLHARVGRMIENIERGPGA